MDRGAEIDRQHRFRKKPFSGVPRGKNEMKAELLCGLQRVFPVPTKLYGTPPKGQTVLQSTNISRLFGATAPQSFDEQMNRSWLCAITRRSYRTPMQVLIIGGTGLISTGIVKHLLARGAGVTVFNRAKRESTLAESA